MLFLCLLLFSEPRDPFVEFDAIYKPLTSATVALAPDQQLYVLDKQAKIIYLLDQNLQIVRTFSGPGEGPGELKMPDNIVVYDQKVFVTDFYKGTQVFDQKGQFLYSRKGPKPFLLLDIVANGWVYQETHNETKTTQIFWASPDLSESTSLISYDVPDQEMFLQLQEGGIKVDFRPGQENPTWHIGQNREKLFVFIPGSQELVVVDVLKREIVGNLPLPFQRQPMNRGWASLQGEALKDRITLNGKKVTVSVNTTMVDHFPLISDFVPGPEGHLWLFDGPSIMKKSLTTSVISPTGAHRNTDLPGEDIKRIIAARKNRVWFLSFDPQKEIPAIRICQRSDISAQLKLYPNARKNPGPKPIDIRTQ